MKIEDNYTLNYYIDKYSIDTLFKKNIRKYMELHKFNKNDYLLTSNQEADYFYFLVKGSLKCYTILKNGKVLLHEILTPLHAVGDVELINNTIPACNIETLGPSICIGIKMNLLRELISNDLVFYKYLASTLSTKLVTYTHSSSINLIYPLENKLASYLLGVHATNPDAPHIKIDSMTELASLFATSYRHLVRTFNNLCDQNIINKDRNRISILDYKTLEKLAGSID
ncbi:cyclic nucleotide-binding domain-containing protein [Anaeromicrobium sediminis]|uniref:Cyclic nucleotide-binding domain-containing protein n=1 Tax=Anaeromicrobium sediminis TaxID=1478221 RepID=A0A267MJD3_9FIRM|nr:cyclic nucleotide-binding domain-containing protein [Anaeromicrobium sediminis]PAB59679.1 hypothetical protein CCE28_08930 [Anaeromicrobium sediminis]